MRQNTQVVPNIGNEHPALPVEVEERVIKVSVQYDSLNDGRMEATAAFISLRPPNSSGEWRWDVGLSSFEEIHGLSRIVLLLPDKLATAIAINQEKNIRFYEDGSYYLTLVTNLLSFYQGVIHPQQVPHLNPDGPLHGVTTFNLGASSTLFYDQNQALVQHSLAETFFRLNTALEVMIDLLVSQRPKNELVAEALSIISQAENLLVLCHVYMDFAYKVLLDIRRKNHLDFGTFFNYRTRAKAKISSLRLKLRNEFKECLHDDEMIRLGPATPPVPINPFNPFYIHNP